MQIVTQPDPVLRQKAVPVSKEEFGSRALANIIKKMSDTLRQTDDGVGIAAPQIGISRQIFIASEEALAIDQGWEEYNEQEKLAHKKQWKHLVFINPRVIQTSREKKEKSEGCLSVPKTYGLVKRAEKIRVRAYDETGHVFERGASKLFAQVLQHELDHLDGKLFIDKAKKIVTVGEAA